MTDLATPLVDDIDDADLHSIDCVCDECVDDIIIGMQEDRAR